MRLADEEIFKDLKRLSRKVQEEIQLSRDHIYIARGETYE